MTNDGHNTAQPASPTLRELHRWLLTPFPRRPAVGVTEQEREDLDQLAVSVGADDDGAENKEEKNGV